MIRLNVDVRSFGRAAENLQAWAEEKKQAVRDVVNESALNIQFKAKRNLTSNGTVDTGRLRSNITIEPVTSDRMTLSVGTYVKYAAAIEFGTRPHVIRPKNKKALFWPGARHPVKSVNHPGTRAQPFLFPAWEEEKPAFERALREVMSE